MKDLRVYEDELIARVKERKGGLDGFLLPAIHEAARCQRMMDRMEEELDGAPLVMKEYGSNGQIKSVTNPLLATYEKMSRTMKLHLAGLGLNYDATPSKVADVENGQRADDGLAMLLSRIEN